MCPRRNYYYIIFVFRTIKYSIIFRPARDTGTRGSSRTRIDTNVRPIMSRWPSVAAGVLGPLHPLLIALLVAYSLSRPPSRSFAAAAAAESRPTPPHRPLVIRAAVLLPAEPKLHVVTLSKVRPVLDMAVSRLYKVGWLREADVVFEFVLKDDKCKDIEAIKSSFELILNGRVDLFLGPTCDYGVGQ